MATLPPQFAGSISEATHHPKHLIPRFVFVLERAEPNHRLVLEWLQVSRAVRTLALFLSLEDYQVEDMLDLWESTDAQEMLNALFDALNEVAPVNTYFGASEGDGASFGFWQYRECPECGQEGGNIACHYCTPDPTGGV